MQIALRKIFLPYQAAWINDPSGVKVYEKSRRIGVTWAEAFDCCVTASTRERSGPGRGQDCWYIGYNREMALEFIDAVASWARRLKEGFHDPEETFIEDEDKNILAYRVRFASGHKVVALSSRPSNLRGKQGIAVIDEAAFHDQLEELLKAALAFRVWGGRVHVISTHNGDANPFNELVSDIRAGRRPYSLHRTTLDDALAQGFYHKICSADGLGWSNAKEQAFRVELLAEYGDKANEELLCIPGSGSGVFLPTALIESRMNPAIPVLRWERDPSFLQKSEYELMKEAEDWCVENVKPILDQIDPKLMTCFGEDFGRSGDLTVIWPLQFTRHLIRRTPFVVELRNVPFRQQEQVLFYIVDRLGGRPPELGDRPRPPFIAGALDARGNGQYLAERAAQRYGGGENGRIQQVMLSIDWYRDNMPRYKAAFEDETIELPRDAQILADHRALRMDKGVARLPEHRTNDGGSQRHGDSAIAGALAYYASTLSPEEYGYTPVRPQIGAAIDDEREDRKHSGRGFGFAARLFHRRGRRGSY